MLTILKSRPLNEKQPNKSFMEKSQELVDWKKNIPNLN